MITLLSHTKINWRSWDEHSSSAFTIRTEGDVLIVFDLDEEDLVKIVYLGSERLRVR
jgi:hypothetical protein